MITRINNNPQQNTFGVKIKTKNVKIDPNLSDHSKEYVTKLLREIRKHNRKVGKNPLANQDVVELAHINHISYVPRHVTDITQTLGIHAKRPNEVIDPYTELRTNTHITPEQVVKNLSDYWDKVTGFRPRKPVNFD